MNHRQWRLLGPALLLAACRSEPAPRASAKNLLLITVDTLRADHVGAYGYRRAQTPALDGLARGVRFERAYATAPITLPSHATLLTGRYPPGHGSRDNGLRVSPDVPTLATVLKARGFRTGAFVAAFPLDHQFGLARGFDIYSDRLPRGPDGRLANERPASEVVSEAIAWLGTNDQRPTTNDQRPTTKDQFFLWIHLFEPHAPYGHDATRPVLDRYDEEIATVDREIGRLLNALGDRMSETVIVATADHGEAFGEHGEWAHSIFVYDTTLRVPLLMHVPGDRSVRVVTDPVTLADVAPTSAKLLGAEMRDVDGIDLAPALAGTQLPGRELYAESFAPLVEFGWAPLRAIRSDRWKYVAAPKPELFDVERDPDEQANLVAAEETVARRLDARVNRYAAPEIAGPTAAADPAAAARLRALGYSSGSRHDSASARPDPKDRRELVARIAQVTSGELSGAALVSALEGIVRDDPRNGQAHLRLGYARLQAGDCARARPQLQAAIDNGLPSADAYLGLATCLGRARDLAGADRALAEAQRLEPDNPAIIANVGILQASRGDHAAAIRSLQSALEADPNLHEARFNLALAYARLDRRADALASAQELLRRLPAAAPQRLEIERLIKSLQ